MVSYLLTLDQLKSAPKVIRLLHDNALQRLIKVGAQHPAHFRSVMQSAPDLKSRLESAVKAQQEAGLMAAQGSASKGMHSSLNSASQPAKPSIKLKTDFSNFTG